ncbi:MAG: hypothetical protein H6985_07445 [Pseudomonadales bacterium]|nr:hypothetical protein [Halioglobus sp.]MCP5129396.1 hypothetical protein [Pseudomonadales bacterium]
MRGVIDESLKSAIVAGGVAAYTRDAAAADSAAQARTPSGGVGYVQLEIRTDTLYSLIHRNVLVIEDLRGLDRQTKSWIRKQLLDTLLL